MADDQILAVDLIARDSDFRRSFERARVSAVSDFDKIEQRAKTMTSRLDTSFANIGGLLKGGLAGMFLGAGAAATAALAPLALFNKALDTIDMASHLVDTADRIGLSTTALQELGFGFAQAGVEQSEFETGMEQFSKRIGEAATKGGRLADILKANGIAIRDSNGQIRTSEQLLASYAELIRNASSEQEKMLLVTEAFGRGGGAMLVGLNDGAKGILNMKKAAEDAGGVIDEQLLRRAEEMGDRWDAAWHRFSVSSQSAILTALEGMDGLNKMLVDNQKLAAAAGLGTLAGSLVPEKGSVITGLGKGDKPDAIDVRISQAFGGEIAKADDKLVEHLKARYGDATRRATIIPGEAGDEASGSKAKSPAPDGFERQLAQTQRRIALMRAETSAQAGLNPLVNDYGDALAFARTKQDLLNAAQQAGKVITPELTATIDEIARSYASASTEAQKLADSQDKTRATAQEMSGLGRDVLGGFISDLRAGASASDMLVNALGKIEDKLLDIALNAIFSTGGGGIMGIIGSLFGFSGGGLVKSDAWAGMRLAGGGHVRGPGTSTSDSIPIMGSDGEFMVNAKATKKHRALIEAINDDRLPAFAAGGLVGGTPAFAGSDYRAGPQVVISAPVTVHGSAGTPAQNDDLAKKMGRQMEATMRGVVADELRKASRPGNLANNRGRR
ncbi:MULTISPECIES: hypothetical protein [unclassified Mesorhizobium]|uniref:hypothetical protein n=1 Tax=unclassified Mesorhizobium TaxID=325217 RepID=UPI0003CF36B9|nr:MULTISPECIES: hypothetical protein [unclassified Mesorhizobium]ESY58319.1 hypothetical protein X745_04700 [Mesorhizobium sp. LNJC374B00]ESY59454.1 hypothetical protein X744_13345 [Mesorhizobium sp. LNJC372A00]WJI79599.1 hypothetical protein NLY34_22400 [Mesorhizobium sp. C374B]WJI86134.1 hypothetical protein NLY42_24795 [Mesorhizobium sp. C372A]